MCHVRNPACALLSDQRGNLFAVWVDGLPRSWMCRRWSGLLPMITKGGARVEPGRVGSLGGSCPYLEVSLGLPRLAGVVGYSGLLNVAMATAIMPRPMAATMPSDRAIGTVQPPQVMPGDSAWTAAGLSDKWSSTACRIGPTT